MNKREPLWLAMLLLSVVLPWTNHSLAQIAGISPLSASIAEDKIAKLPLMFRENKGQWDNKVLFAGSAPAANVYFMKNELSFGFTRRKGEREEEEGEKRESVKYKREETLREAREIYERAFGYAKDPRFEFENLVWNVKFEGANENSRIIAAGKTGSAANYFKGSDPSRYCINVPDYKLLTYQNIYDHIDLQYYGTNSRLKYDFVVKPNADVADIKMTYRGIKKIRIGRNGELILSTAWGNMKEEKPFTYQYKNGKPVEVRSSYVLLNDSTVGFKMLEDYSKDKELIIDPVVLDWATFVAGSGTNMGTISRIAMDTQGNVYAVGSYQASFPTTPGSYDPTFNGAGTDYDAFVFKINTTGTALIYATYIGGNQWDSGASIYLNAANEVYVTGQTSSFNFPTLNAYDNSYNGGGDALVFKLNAAGSGLIFSTFVGGSGADVGSDVTLDPTGNVYVVGNTTSANFPTTAGVYSAVRKGLNDLIVFKLGPAGNALLYSTLIGSSKNDTGVGIFANAAGEVTVGCNTDSLDFPTTAGAYDQTYNDGPNIYNLKGDMAIFKFNAAASSLIYSTFLGGNVGDVMQGFYVSAKDEPYACGVILFSNNYPITAGVIGPTTANGTFDSFVTRLNSSGSGLIYSTYLGNADQSSDEARDIYVNACDEAYVTGDGGSYTTFPQTTGPCTTCKGGEDIYVCKLNPGATALVWSTFIGSKDWDVNNAIAVNTVGPNKEEIAIGFGSSSKVFPTTTGVFQPVKPAPDSIYTQPGIAKWHDTLTSGVANAGPDVTICSGANATLTATGGTNYVWSPGGQTTSAVSVSPSATTTYTVSVSGSCGAAIDTVTVYVNSALTAVILGGNVSICAGQSVTLTGSGGTEFSWNTGSSAATIVVSPTATSSYSVIVSSGSCAPDTVGAMVIVSSPPVASITGNGVLCSGQSTTLTASGGGTYSWNTGSSSSAIVVSPTANTTYSVSVSNGSCSVTATQSVSVSPAINLSASSTATGCTVNVGTATANASAGTSPFTYSWSNGQTASVATGLGAGNYTVTVTDAGGCTKTQTVSVSSTSNLASTASTTQTGCAVANGSATVTPVGGTSPYTYSWNNGQTTQTATGLAAGNYTATITDASGCTVTATASVTAAPGPNATAVATATNITLGSGTNLTATGGGTYQWSPTSGLSCTSCSNPTATPTETTNYCVIVTDANGCSDSACVLINVEIPCGNIYIPNAFSPNNDAENDLECVFGNCITDMHLYIYNRWGQVIFESTDQADCWDGTYKNDPLNPAVFPYYLEATLKTGEKIIKKGNISLIK